jgi:two-component system, chemotaxis family, chemotaxis protein CheY
MRERDLERILHRSTIVLADGNQFMRRLTRTMLNSLGIRSVFEVSDGASALQAILTSRPDVLLTEWCLPIVTAAHLIRSVRAEADVQLRDLPIIVLTTQSDRASVLQAVRAGANEFLEKPTSAKALKDRLAYVISKPRPVVRIGSLCVPLPRIQVKLEYPPAS